MGKMRMKRIMRICVLQRCVIQRVEGLDWTRVVGVGVGVVVAMAESAASAAMAAAA